MIPMIKKVFYDEQTFHTLLGECVLVGGILLASPLATQYIGKGGIVGTAIALAAYMFNSIQRYKIIPNGKESNNAS